MSFAPVHVAGPVALSDRASLPAFEGMLERSAGQLKQRTVPALQPVSFTALAWVVGTVGDQAAITFECHGGKFVRVLLEPATLTKCLAALPVSAQLGTRAVKSERALPKIRGPITVLSRAQLIAALRDYCQPGANLDTVAAQYHVATATLARGFQQLVGCDYLHRARAARADGAAAIEAFVTSFPQ